MSKTSQIVIAISLFVAGGATAYFVLPVKVETVVQTKTVEKVVHEKQDIKETKITKKDGTIVETKITSTDTKTGEKSKEDTFRKTETNTKKLLVYIGKDLLHPTQNEFLAGFSYSIFSSVEIGGQFNSAGNLLSGTIGYRF